MLEGLSYRHSFLWLIQCSNLTVEYAGKKKLEYESSSVNVCVYIDLQSVMHF